MRNMSRRVERLERTIGVSKDLAFRTVISVDFVSATDGKVVRSLVLEPGQPQRWIDAPARAELTDFTEGS
jgi:hypothetical protein